MNEDFLQDNTHLENYAAKDQIKSTLDDDMYSLDDVKGHENHSTNSSSKDHKSEENKNNGIEIDYNKIIYSNYNQDVNMIIEQEECLESRSDDQSKFKTAYGKIFKTDIEKEDYVYNSSEIEMKSKRRNNRPHIFIIEKLKRKIVIDSSQCKSKLKKSKKKASIRYDEPLKNAKSKAFKNHLAKIKELEKDKKKKESLELLIQYFRELFIVDANKKTNNARLNFTLEKLFQSTITDIYNKIAKLKENYKNEENKRQEKDYEKLRNLSLELSKLENNYEKITTNFGNSNIADFFINEDIKGILKKTYIEIFEEFSKSEDNKRYKQKLQQKKNDEYLQHYDIICNNIEKYFGNVKIKNDNNLGIINKLVNRL